MAKQPAVVIIVRHGARLDQADREWTERAETPWDPPLTYGGWIQCQMLGTRIQNELQSLEALVGGEDNDHNRPRKKRRVVMHSSPYLRCIQTSIAIGAGLKQSAPTIRLPVRNRKQSLQPRTPLVTSMSQEHIAEENEKEESQKDDKKPDQTMEKPSLKVDAFLGEWLSPSYFEAGQAPPPSAELVATAKKYLARPAREIKGADFSAVPIYEFDSIDWEEKQNEASTMPLHEKSGLRGTSNVGQSSLVRSQTFSAGIDLSRTHRQSNKNLRRPLHSGYVAPVPTYAIAPTEAIPIGFVEHARDACIAPDQEWDSEKSPLEWGDGGQYTEEWGVMHRRLNNGIQKMIAHYEQTPSDSGDDENVVLILVSHQADCNALIRLMTGAPALHDIGLASLTMATRKVSSPTLRHSASSPTSPVARRRGSLETSMAEDFDMRIIASTEHLRAGSNPLGLNSPRLGQSPALASRRTVGADSPEGFSIGESLSWRPNSSGGLQRSRSQRSYAADTGADPQPGLWTSAPRHTRAASMNSNESSDRPNLFGRAVSGQSIAEEASPTEDGDKPKTLQPPVRRASQMGLWGDPSAAAATITRSRSPGQRRWTAGERTPSDRR